MEIITAALVCAVIGNVVQGIALYVTSRVICRLIDSIGNAESGCRVHENVKTRIISPYKENDKGGGGR